jgi:hypothetical protein
MEKIYTEEIENIKKELDGIRTQIPSKILETKHDLLSVYLMNLVLYNELAEDERKESPVMEVLVRTTILLEKICVMEQKATDVIKEELSKSEKAAAEGRRLLTDVMLKDRGDVARRKPERRTPARGYRYKAQRLAETARVVHDDSINVKRTRTSKFE